MSTEHPTAEKIAERVRTLRSHRDEYGWLNASGWTECECQDEELWEHKEHRSPIRRAEAIRIQQQADVIETLGYLEHLLAERNTMLFHIQKSHATGLSERLDCPCEFCTEYRTLTQKGETA